MTAFQVKIEQFQGPFDVLLQLIEEHELNITDITLSTITDEFIRQLSQVEERYPEDLADFLVVAARLLYLKSRALLPFLQTEDDETPGQLAARLKMYREFRDAAEQLSQRLLAKQYSIERPSAHIQNTTVEFNPPPKLTTADLTAAYQRVLDRLDTVIRIPQAAIRKAITLKEKISSLASLLEQYSELSFNHLTAEKKDRFDVVMTFLAVLELVKQDLIDVRQNDIYSDIIISRL